LINAFVFRVIALPILPDTQTLAPAIASQVDAKEAELAMAISASSLLWRWTITLSQQPPQLQS